LSSYDSRDDVYEIDPIKALIVLAFSHGKNQALPADLCAQYFTENFRVTQSRKRVFDIVIAVTCLVLFAPILLLVAFLIKITSRGPVFFRQKRFGRGGTIFRIYKFRTLRIDQEDPDCRVPVRIDDTRVTTVGRLLRRTSIDELPQLINVIRGEMSLVGPRPHCTNMKIKGELYHTLYADHTLRYLVMPGITGWAQIHGSRGPVESIDAARKRIDLDLYYIRHLSIALDCQILLRTIGVVLRGIDAF